MLRVIEMGRSQGNPCDQALFYARFTESLGQLQQMIGRAVASARVGLKKF